VTQRVRLVLIGAFACLFAGFVGLWAAAYNSAGESELRPDPGAGFSGAVRPEGARVPAFHLRDQDGEPVTAASTKGRTAVYVFLYSTCEDTCPLQVQQIRGAMDDLGRDVPVVGVSVDPANDTARRARTFMLEQHLTGRMRFALGTADELRPVWQAFGVRPQRDGKEHSASVVVVDADGRQRLGYRPSYLTVDGLAADLRRLGA
jgi:protein SCO1/2